MFDEYRFETGIGMGRYFRDLPIRLVSNEELIKNSACNLAIILIILKSKIGKSKPDSQNLYENSKSKNFSLLLFFCSSEFAINVILGNI